MLKIISRAFGVLKMRWRIIDHTGGMLCYTPEKASKIIMACFILHNICRRKNIQDSSCEIDDNSSENGDVNDTDSVATDADGISIRQEIVNMFS